MNAYSEDLRKKIVEAVERGMPKIEAARTFGVGISSVKRYIATYHQGRSGPEEAPRLQTEAGRRREEAFGGESRGAPGGNPAPEARVLAAGVRGGGQRLYGFQDAQAHGLEPKKRSVGASERDEWLRAAWRALVAGTLDADRLVFVDEMGTNTSLTSLYAWSRRGERALASVPRNWRANITLLASMSAEGMGPCLAVEGSTTRELFEAYLERVLAPSLRPGQVVMMDNLSSHKGSQVRELIEKRGCELRYLPPYSPDLNPIEEAFAKLKALLRKAGARTYEALIEAMGRALEAVTASDARGFLEHRGYRAKAHLL
jgi:transposase